MVRVSGTVAMAAWLLLCFVYLTVVENYVDRQKYNNRVVHSNSTCDNCVTIGYYASTQDESGNCRVHSVDNCSRGLYVGLVGMLKCGDEAKYKLLVDQSKIGQPTERCSFDSEGHVYQSIEEYYKRIFAYSNVPWFDYAMLWTTGLGLVVVPLLARRFFYTPDEE